MTIEVRYTNTLGQVDTARWPADGVTVEWSGALTLHRQGEAIAGYAPGVWHTWKEVDA